MSRKRRLPQPPTRELLWRMERRANFRHVGRLSSYLEARYKARLCQRLASHADKRTTDRANHQVHRLRFSTLAYDNLA